MSLKIHPSAVREEDGLKALVALLKTYMEMGGYRYS
jgi:hypothetical protein